MRTHVIANLELIAVSSISYGEVMLGLKTDTPGWEAAKTFFEMAEVLPFDREAARFYARLPFRRRGFDRLIAAHALALNATLVTNNPRDFEDIPNLRVENWL